MSTTMVNNKTILHFPDFQTFNLESAKKVFDEALEACKVLKETLINKAVFTWQDFVLPINEADEYLSRIFSPISHLNAVKNTR